MKRPGRESEHSPPSRDQVKNTWSYNFTPPYTFTALYFVNHRDNFTFVIYIHFMQVQMNRCKSYAPELIQLHTETYETSNMNSSLQLRFQIFHHNRSRNTLTEKSHINNFSVFIFYCMRSN